MERIHDNLGSINQESSIANRKLNEIKSSRAKNKMILYGVLATIALALLVVVVVKFT
jgi:t-SNARE complex subunit (syntaxin)